MSNDRSMRHVRLTSKEGYSQTLHVRAVDPNGQPQNIPAEVLLPGCELGCDVPEGGFLVITAAEGDPFLAHTEQPAQAPESSPDAASASAGVDS